MVSGGMATDLRESPLVLTKDAFKAVLVEGISVKKGMPRFSHFQDQELVSLMQYIRDRARNSLNNPSPLHY